MTFLLNVTEFKIKKRFVEWSNHPEFINGGKIYNFKIQKKYEQLSYN